MRSNKRRGVPPAEHIKSSSNVLADWDHARIFLDVARGGSFRSAAERLGLSINLVRRRIERFEKEVGTALFRRDVHGVHLTEEGQEMVAAAEAMEAASFGLLRARNLVTPVVTGEIRIAITEGLGGFWLSPRLTEFQRRNPNILVDLYCDMRSADVLRHEADIAVQLARPVSPDVKAVKLGRLHVMMFASPSYIKLYGEPKSYTDLFQHRFVLQAPDAESAREVYRSIFPKLPPQNLVVMRNNVSSANYFSIAGGAGIGFLPTYAGVLGRGIVPINVDFKHSFEIWLSYHPGTNRIPRVRRMIDWIVESFDQRRYPWFRDNFIHPNELPKNVLNALPDSPYSIPAEN